MLTTIMLLNSAAALAVAYYAIKLMRSRMNSGTFPPALLERSERELAQRSAECARNGHEWGVTLTLVEVGDDGDTTAHESIKICTHCHEIADGTPPMPLRETDEE